MAAARPPKPEKHTAFCYSFTPRQLKYFLFGKKTCPRCGGALRRHKGYTTLHGTMPHSHDKPIRVDTSRVKLYRYHLYLRRLRRRLFPGGAGRVTRRKRKSRAIARLFPCPIPQTAGKTA